MEEGVLTLTLTLFPINNEKNKLKKKPKPNIFRVIINFLENYKI
jgi:hypothetical protein